MVLSSFRLDNYDKKIVSIVVAFPLFGGIMRQQERFAKK